jgi:NAD(P)-dependent dehydrogenase (short-subunit alcohol dehydrogenase family)
MQEKAPGLPAVQARDMAALKTLGQIVAKLEGDRPAVAAAPVAAPPAAAPVAAAAPAVDLKALLLQVVADKTGYPTDMLSMDMALEADLGIDSIKRVEILSAMQEKAPGLPAVQARDMAALKTLGQIVAKLEGDRPAAPIAAPPVAAPAAPAVAAAPAAHGLDLKALLLQVVADKTGYPTDMLSMDMALEADLGIDSIKRVEILSAMQEKAPGLPAVQARDMAALKTLGQIVAKLEGGEKPAPAAAVVAEGSLGKAVDLKRAGAARFEVIVSEAPGVGLGAAGLLTAAKVLVTSDGSGVAEALVEKLREAGLTAEVVAAAPEGAEALIFLGGLRDVRSVAEAIEVNREAFRAARACAGTLSTRGGLLVTVQDTGGDLGFSGASGVRAWMGGLTGLAKSAAAEWPRATVRAVDLERGGRPAAEVAAQLLRELLTGGEEPEVGLSAAGRRVVPRSQAAAPPAGALAVDASSVIVATGGARGVTAACLVALAQAARPRIALIGRTPLADEPASLRGLDEAALGKAILAEARAAGRALTPATLRGEVQRLVAAREVRGTLAALAAAGSEAIYLSADAQDAASLTAAFAEVRRRLGPITGVVHGAGVLADKLIVEKTEDQVERVLATKVGGLQALLDATAGDPIRTLCLFSSVAARAGNAGQSDYAMANEILNKVAAAEAKRRPGCVVSSLNWGPWEGGMVTPALAAHFKSRGVPLIAIDAGAQSMVDEHRTGSASIEVVLGGSPDGEGLQRGGLQERRHGVLVNRATYPMLDSHRVQGPVVVPAVAALDWFVRAASLAGLGPVEVRDLRVLKGIRVEHFDGAGLRLVVVARPAGEGLDLELRGVDGSIHYSARAQRAEGPIGPGISAPEGLSPWGVEAASTYNGALFHGPLFQALRSLDGFSAQGATATMKGSRELGWPEAPYGLDPALLDGGLQLARLWALQKLGRPSLPTKIGSYRGAAGLVTGPIRCLLRSRSVGDYRTVSDIAFLDAAGALVAELREVDMHTMASAEPVKLAPATPGE